MGRLEGEVTAVQPPVKPPTLADLAREAGTSASTASRALSGHGYVSPNARTRLLEAAERLGYVPNLSARTLKQRTSRVVGVVVSDLSNQFYARLAAGIEQVLRDAGYQMVILGDNSEIAAELDGARTFVAMRAPGVIMTPVSGETASLLAAQGTAVVEVDRRLAATPCDAVVIDNERGAREATLHLLGLGHRRVGLLAVDTDWTTDAGRVEGYRSAHQRAGVPIDERLIVRVPVQAPDAEERIGRLFAYEAPTAIFAANNLLAEQAWRVLRKRSLRLPENCSLVGFDDVPWMEMVDPSITVVDQPTVEMGRCAARLLLARIEDPTGPPRIECLQPSLILRRSTAPPS
ncbi:MAG: LacI family transcriptional regulator [Gaiellaceae bacterium]|nr:LacI family transcriptional regulator [Gaiellaceae bacterium]